MSESLIGRVQRLLLLQKHKRCLYKNYVANEMIVRISSRFDVPVSSARSH